MGSGFDLLQVYEEALKSVPSGTMFSLYANFLMGIVAPKDEEPNIDGPYISHLLSIYERAESMGIITDDLACKHVSLHLQLRQLDEARKLVAKLCSGKLAESVQLWELRVSIEITCITQSSLLPSDADLLSLFELLRQILTKFHVSKSENLWLKVCCHHLSLVFVAMSCIKCAPIKRNQQIFYKLNTSVNQPLANPRCD